MYICGKIIYIHTSSVLDEYDAGTGTGIFAGGRSPIVSEFIQSFKLTMQKLVILPIRQIFEAKLPSTATGQYGALVGASSRSSIEGSDFIRVIENPLIKD